MKECFRPAHIRWVGLRKAHFAGEDRQAGETRAEDNPTGTGIIITRGSEGREKKRKGPSFNAASKHQQSMRASALGRDWDFYASQPAQANGEARIGRLMFEALNGGGDLLGRAVIIVAGVAAVAGRGNTAC